MQTQTTNETQEAPRRGRPPKDDSQISNQTIEVNTSEFVKLQDQVALLTKAASKARLARYAPPDKRGYEAKVTIFQDDLNAEPLLVTEWKLIKDYVKYTEKSDDEDQQVEITLENGEKKFLPQVDFGHLPKISVDIIVEKSKYTKIRNQDGEEFMSFETMAFEWKGKVQEFSITFMN